MQIQNKFEKFLTVVSSLAIMVATIMGIKIKEDSKKLDKFGKNLVDNNASFIDILDTQKQIMAGREAILDKLANAAAPEMTRAVTTRTVIPGKVVAQKVPVTSSKKTKSS